MFTGNNYTFTIITVKDLNLEVLELPDIDKTFCRIRTKNYEFNKYYALRDFYNY